VTSDKFTKCLNRTPIYADTRRSAPVKLVFLLNLIAGQEFTDEQLMNARDALVDKWSRRLISHILDLPLDGADAYGRKLMVSLAGPDQPTAMPMVLMADESSDITTRLVAFLRPDPKMTIEVEKKATETDPPIFVYQVVVEDGRGGGWSETFATEELLMAFLRGIRVTYAMSDLQRLLPHFGDDAKLEFTAQSAIKNLP
jgi:hypothetical protein